VGQAARKKLARYQTSDLIVGRLVARELLSNTVIAVGKSILNRSSGADIGALMLSYGGGGHANAGTCQVPHDQADRVVDEIVGQLHAASLQV